MSAPPLPTVEGITCPACGTLYPAGERHTCAGEDVGATVTSPSGIQGDSLGVTSGSPADGPPPDDALLGTVVNDRYEILAQLGQGGMGVVYKARHTLLDSPVAVKVLLLSPDEKVGQRFLQEAKLASQVRHPNIVYISDYGILPDQRPYLIMEYIQGETLAMLNEERRLPLPRALRIATQICRGLRAIHALGIVHRDLKPENIFVIKELGDRELVKIVDFGIATKTVGVGATPSGARSSVPPPGSALAAVGRKGITEDGTLIGTPAFMAPEQIQGLALDQRADQYSLGCILYEMFTGELPFNATSVPGLLALHLAGTVEPMRKKFPHLGLPAELDVLVGRLLAKQQTHRFASISEVESALVRILDRVAPEGGGWTRRRWSLLGTLSLAGVLAVGGTYLALRASGRFAWGTESPLEPGELQRLRGAALEVAKRFLTDPSPELRIEALAAIGQTHDGTLLPLLYPLLGDSHPVVQAQAAEVIGQIGEQQGIAALLPLLSGARPAFVTAAASVALDQLGDPQGREKLGQLLRSDAPESQFRAALALCRRGESEAVGKLNALLPTLTIPADVEQQALGCLALRGDERARLRLRERLRGPLHNKVKLAPAAELAQIGDPVARKFLKDLADTPGPEQILAGRWLVGPAETALLKLFRQVLANAQAQVGARALAAESLGEGGDLVDVRQLAPHLRAETPELALSSAGALLKLAAGDPSFLSPQSLRFGQLAATASSWSVRQSAAAVLGDSVHLEDALAQLTQLQDDVDPRVRRQVARAFGHRQEYAALVALHKSLQDSDAGVRKEALTALALVGQALRRRGQSGVQETVAGWVAPLLTKGTPEEEAQARAVLLQLGDESQRPRVLAIVADGSPAARLAAIENAGADKELLGRGLADPDFAIRLSAARALARLGDRRALPVLKEALASGGPRALEAFGLRQKLGETDAPPEDLDRTPQDKDPLARSQSVLAAATLPLPQALAVLQRAAKDSDPTVRLRALEVAAELRGGTAQLPGSGILRLLLTDPDPAVRARAASLLAAGLLATDPGSRLLSPAPAVSTPASSTGSPTDLGKSAALAADRPGETGTPLDPDTGLEAPFGSLLLEGSVGTPFQLDRLPWSAIGKHPLHVAPGSHTVKYVDGQVAVVVVAQQVVKAQIPPSVVEKLTHAGQERLSREEFGKAQKQLERAGQLCSHDHRYAVQCAGMRQEIAFALARVYEGQDRPAEAMGEYEKVLAGGDFQSLPGQKATVQVAVQRLQGQLGQVLVPKKSRSGCKQDRIWLPPGTHTVKIAGQSTSVKVHAREVVKIGECE